MKVGYAGLQSARHRQTSAAGTWSAILCALLGLALVLSLGHAVPHARPVAASLDPRPRMPAVPTRSSAGATSPVLAVPEEQRNVVIIQGIWREHWELAV